MKAIQGFLGFGLCLVSMGLASAQSAACNAEVTKKSVKPSTRYERGLDIQFDVSVNGCAASSGTFEYVVDLEEKGKTESQTMSANFQTEKPGTTTITVSYGAPAFKDAKGVRGVKVKTCTCNS